MRFTELYGITRTAKDDWFDPLLTTDTELFIDPFLLYASEADEFSGSHAEVVAFFNSVFQYIAKSQGNRDSLSWLKAVDLLRFREVDELCLGYTAEGTRGAGSGPGYAQIIAGALWEAVAAGLEEITHFEEVAILREGIGADRISDITAYLLRARLAAYTTRVCQEHAVPLKPTRYPRGSYDADRKQWKSGSFMLPENPYSGTAVLLVPRAYLRSLPTITPDDFWAYCYDNENEALRTRYSEDVSRHVSKRTIVDLARNRPDLRAQYMASVEQSGSAPYDLDADPDQRVRWYDATRDYVAANPVALTVASDEDFFAVVNCMITEFTNYIENQRGWALLWNDDDTPRKETSAQDLFQGIVRSYHLTPRGTGEILSEIKRLSFREFSHMPMTEPG